MKIPERAFDTSQTHTDFLPSFSAELVVYSPGRINLIGEHTDYNNGFVMPAAIDKKIKLSFQRNDKTNECRIFSANYNKSAFFDLKNIQISKNEWENYLLGTLDGILKRGGKLEGFDCLIESNLPVGSGISSSAALECGFTYGLNELFGLGLDKMTMIEIAQKAEHDFVGTKCGIMDQFSSMMGKADQIIKLDCQSLEYEYIPAGFEPYELVLLNTNVSHNLADSEYNTRGKECAMGVEIFQKNYPEIKTLRDANLELLEKHKEEFPAKIYQRCHYVISENRRVNASAEKIAANDFKAFGKLMYASHEGLQNEYEVSCKELDFLVDFSRKNDQVIGSRMMGGGFGGCTINLVHKDAKEAYIEDIKKAYHEKFDIELSVINVAISDGTSLA